MQPITVREHRWGEAAADLAPPFDVVVACGARTPHAVAAAKTRGHSVAISAAARLAYSHATDGAGSGDSLQQQ